MANPMFDINTWYTIQWAIDGGTYLQSSGLFFAWYQGVGYGSASLSPYNPLDDNNPFGWQFFPSPTNSSQYILRPGNAHPPAWLNAVEELVFGDETCTDDCSSSTLAITNVTDQSSYWTVIPSGDGQTSYLANSGNGTGWYMTVDTSGNDPASSLNMGTSANRNRSLMQFEFSSIRNVDDPAFSTLAPSFTPSSVPSSTSALASSKPLTQSSTTPLPTHVGSSTGVGATVGGAVGGVAALLIAVVAILWFWRRRTRRRTNQQHVVPPPPPPPYANTTAENNEKKKAADIHSPTLNEAPADNHILEAPSSGIIVARGGEATNPAHGSEIFELEGQRV